MLTWKFRPYLGLGAAAHSFIHDKRISNVANLGSYLNSEIEKTAKIERSKPSTEVMIGALRITVFQSYRYFKRILNDQEYIAFRHTLTGFSKHDWVQCSDKGFTITKKGLLFSDHLVQEMSMQIDKYS